VLYARVFAVGFAALEIFTREAGRRPKACPATAFSLPAQSSDSIADMSVNTDTPRYTALHDWYEMDQVARAVYRIRERYYREDYRCNIYLVKGTSRDLVIDAGLGLASLPGFLAPWTERPLLILTHAHYDHIGSAFEFADRAIHRAEAPVLANPTRAETLADLLLATEDFLRLPWDGYDAAHWQPRPAPPTLLLADADIVDTGDRVFEVLNTPGHSWGSICLWHAPSRLMICADTIYDGELFDHLPCSDKPAYVRSMRRLQAMPVDIALPGHGPVLTGDRFRAIAQGYINREEDGDTGPID
jgi:glyoxylase-like metal-dependent hydrolase (beta-lactamase superfamily II)